MCVLPVGPSLRVSQQGAEALPYLVLKSIYHHVPTEVVC
jgi:hypothetical protein